MAEKQNSPNIIITNAENFYEHIDMLITKRIEGLKDSLEKRDSAVSEDNEWLTANKFCSHNGISPTTLSRYVRDDMVEKRVVSRQNIRYRWKG